MSEPYVALAMPRAGGITEGAAQGFYLWPMRPGKDGTCRCIQLQASSSLLNHCFNTLWASALSFREKIGLTHFAMIHSDVSPDRFWLNTLLDELTRLDADVVSAVIPMKDHKGLTSTGIQTDDPWETRRLTMREVMNLPETFSAKDVGGPLALNTGLWVCDFTKPWCEDLVFNSRERIVRKSDGDYESQVISEDWLMSQRLNQLGCKLYATRKVGVSHEGSIGFTNEYAWGQWDRDETHYRRMAKTDEPVVVNGALCNAS